MLIAPKLFEWEKKTQANFAASVVDAYLFIQNEYAVSMVSRHVSDYSR